MKAKIVRFLTDLNGEYGINSKDADFARYGGWFSGIICGIVKVGPWAIVIECYQIIGNNIAYRPLYGHLKNTFSLCDIFFIDRLSKIIFFVKT